MENDAQEPEFNLEDEEECSEKLPVERNMDIFLVSLDVDEYEILQFVDKCGYILSIDDLFLALNTTKLEYVQLHRDLVERYEGRYVTDVDGRKLKNKYAFEDEIPKENMFRK